MDVTPAWYTNQPTRTPTSAEQTGTRISSDFNTFLKMLTAQIQNQDPLNPIDSAEYAVQLATFSSVEQQTRTNQLLSGLSGQFDLLGMSQLAGWVGNEARTAGPVWFAGEPVSLSPNPAVNADRAVLVVKDTSGNVVARNDIPVSSETMLWDGASMTGGPLPSGRYSLSLESYRDEVLLSSDPVEAYARIVEVQGGSGGNRLILSGGITVPASEVTALRNAA